MLKQRIFSTILSLRPSRSLRATLYVQTFFLLVIVVALLSTMTFFFLRFEVRNRALAQLDIAMRRRADTLQSLISHQREQISLLSQDPHLRSLPAAKELVGFEALVSVDPVLHTSVVLDGTISPSVMDMIMNMSLSSQNQFFSLFSLHDHQRYMLTSKQTDGKHMLVAIFNADPLLQPLLIADIPGKTVRVDIAHMHNGSIILLNDPQQNGHMSSQVLLMDDGRAERMQSAPLFLALRGESGFSQGVDYFGIQTFASYVALPSLNWAMVVQIDESEVYKPVSDLAWYLLAAGLSMIGMLSFVMFSFSQRISAPLEKLVWKLDGLETKKWKFSRSIFTGNEIESVDDAAFQLTKRLRNMYRHLESIVRQRTKTLLSQHARDAAIFRSIDYGLIVTDARGAIVLMNAAAQQLTGWKEERCIGKQCSHILRIVDRHMRAVTSESHPVNLVLRTRRSLKSSPDPKLSIFHKNGTIMPLSLRVTPILRGKSFHGVVAIFRDTTEDRRIDAMKSDFISLVSHQLRTPLSAMRWYLEMLLAQDAGSLNPQQQNFLKEVSSSNYRMVRLVDVLLNVSKIELGKFALNVQTIDFQSILKNILKLFAQEVHTKQLTVRMKGFERLSVLHIRTDAVLLQLILENIISNAVKYTKEKGHILIHVRKSVTRRNYLEVRVEDTGIGIPSLQQKHVFEKLFRADNAKQSDTDGNGLGLYVSRTAAQALGGELSFRSTEAKGTIFTLFLPLGPYPSLHALKS